MVYWATDAPDYLRDIDSITGKDLIIDDIRQIAPDFSTYIYSIAEHRFKTIEVKKKRSLSMSTASTVTHQKKWHK